MRAETGRGGRVGAGKGGGAEVEIGEEVATTEEAGNGVEVEAEEGLEAAARGEAEAGRSGWKPGQNCRERLKMLPWATTNFTFEISAAGAGNQS